MIGQRTEATPRPNDQRGSLINALRRPHFWLVAAMLSLGALLSYGHFLPPLAGYLPFVLTRYSMERTIYLLPVIYGTFVFGARGGGLTLAVAALLLVHEALAYSPNRAEAVLESTAILLVAGAILVAFQGLQKMKARRQEVVATLEVARQELSHHIEVIKKNERQLSAINKVCRVVAESLDLLQTLDRILDEVLSLADVEIALIHLKNPDTQELELAAHRGVSAAFAQAAAALKVGQGYSGAVAETGSPMAVDDASADTRPGVEHVRQEGIRSQLIVPVKSRGLVIGTLCIATRSLRTFQPEEQELLAAIGGQVGTAIENARLYREVRDSEEKYRDLFENASAAIFVHNPAGEIVDANRACLDLTGYAREELMHMNVSRLGLPKMNGALQQTEDRLLKSEPPGKPYEAKLRRKDGSESIVSLSTRVIAGDGQPLGFEHIARDITEQKRMRQNLDFYLKQILTTQEEERKRIARELHDETAQSLLLISQRLDGLSSAYRQPSAGPARRSLEEVRDVALKALADMRRLTQDLRPRILDDLGLTAVLEWMTDDLKKQYGVNAGVTVTGTERQLTPETQLLLFRIAQEALSNIRRHAEASAAAITLEFNEGKVRMTVTDNGKGFKVPETLSDLASAGKLGLLGMNERARLVGGTATIRSKPGEGTTVVVELPV